MTIYQNLKDTFARLFSKNVEPEIVLPEVEPPFEEPPHPFIAMGIGGEFMTLRSTVSDDSEHGFRTIKTVCVKSDFSVPIRGIVEAEWKFFDGIGPFTTITGADGDTMMANIIIGASHIASRMRSNRGNVVLLNDSVYANSKLYKHVKFPRNDDVGNGWTRRGTLDGIRVYTSETFPVNKVAVTYIGMWDSPAVYVDDRRGKRLFLMPEMEGYIGSHKDYVSIIEIKE